MEEATFAKRLLEATKIIQAAYLVVTALGARIAPRVIDEQRGE